MPGSGSVELRCGNGFEGVPLRRDPFPVPNDAIRFRVVAWNVGLVIIVLIPDAADGAMRIMDV